MARRANGPDHARRALRVQTFVVDGQRYALAPVSGPPLEGLSAAEREVARLAVAGRTSAQIAGVRRVSVRTIDAQLASIYRKLGVSSRAELAALRP